MPDEWIDQEFEARLRAALRRHVSEAPGGFDAVAFAHAVAVGQPRRRWSWPAPWALAQPVVRRGPARLPMLLVVAGLVLALLAAALLAGGRLQPAEWRQLDVPGGGTFYDVAVDASGMTAMGPSLERSGQAQAWHSRNGSTWETATIAGGGTWPADVMAVTTWDGGFVAVGGTTIMTSRDGAEWSWVLPATVEISGTGFTHGHTIKAGMFDVIALGSRLVAVGSLWDPLENASEPAIWTSTDARAWHLVAPLDGAEPGETSGLRAIVAGGPGLVAVGAAETGAPVWVSSDGLAWTRAPAAGWPARSGLTSVARGPGGTLAACGSSDVHVDQVPGFARGTQLWASPDGLTWTMAADLASLAGGIQGRRVECSGVAGTADEFVASATAITVQERTGPAESPSSARVTPFVGLVLTSPDGRTWRVAVSTGSSDEVLLKRALAAGDGLFLSGDRWTVEYGVGMDRLTTWYHARWASPVDQQTLPGPTASPSR